MSFRVDLWNGVNVIKQQFSQTLTKISNLYNILMAYASYEKAYSKSMESLYRDNSNLFKDENLLDKSLSTLINNFKLEGEYHRQHYKYIKHNVAMSLKEMTDKEKSESNNLFNEGALIQDNMAKIKNNLINKQKNYNNNLKDFYSFVSNFNESELISVLEIENKETSSMKVASSVVVSNDLNLNRISTMEPEANINKLINNINSINKQQISKRQKLGEKIFESKKEYATLLNEANSSTNLYKTRLENVLQSLEEKYQFLLSNIRSSLTTTVDNRLSLLNKVSLLNNSYLEENLKNINVKNEILEYIEKNATKEFPIYKFEFITNKFDNKNLNMELINKYLNENLEVEMNLEIGLKRGRSRKKTDVRRVRKRSVNKKNTGNQKENAILILENENISKDIKKYKIRNNINLLEDFFDELIISKDDEDENEKNNIENNDDIENTSNKMKDIDNIKLLIDKKNNDHQTYLENLIKILNNHRAKGNFLLAKKSYDIFIDIFTFILTNYPMVDFLLKNIIILAQTFYIYEDEKSQLNFSNDKKKIFLQNGLKNNKIFNNPETWHRAINFTLASHVYNKDISQVIDKNEMNNKLHVLAYNTLVAYLCDLKYFTDDETVFEQVKDFYVKTYQLDGDKIYQEVCAILNVEPTEKKNN
jgi:hypothetical protein